MKGKKSSLDSLKEKERLLHLERSYEVNFIKYFENVKILLESPDPLAPLYRFRGGLDA